MSQPEQQIHRCPLLKKIPTCLQVLKISQSKRNPTKYCLIKYEKFKEELKNSTIEMHQYRELVMLFVTKPRHFIEFRIPPFSIWCSIASWHRPLGNTAAREQGENAEGWAVKRKLRVEGKEWKEEKTSLAPSKLGFPAKYENSFT